MKIAIPVTQKNWETAMVCVSFGRTPYFMFYDTQSKEVTFQDNTAAKAQGGAGIKAAQCIVDSKSDALLTIRCGQNSADVLCAGEIEIYKASESTAASNITAFQEGKLDLMTQFHAGFHSHQ